MKIKFNISNDIVAEKMKKITFLDIETSLIDVRLFSTGQQYVNISQTRSQTHILTVAGGTMHDLYTKGEAGVWSYGNHQFDTFKDNPLDDSEVLKKVWKILDDSDVIVAHNAKFDTGWLNGRFLQLGYPLPSPYKTVCTYRGLTGFSMNSKKLDVLSNTLIGSSKIKTDWSLWDRCSEGDRDAFEEMMQYNIGDIYDTLFQVYIRTAAYYPAKAANLSIPGIPSCRVSGQELVLHGMMTNEANGNDYDVYKNKDLNIYYRDRSKQGSKKAGQGFLIPLK
jgi:hypothetical protein